MHNPALHVAAALLSLASAASGAVPKLDITNIPGYVRALDASKDLQAAAIRRRIASGPLALAKEIKACKAEGIRLTDQTPTMPAPDENAALIYMNIDILLGATPVKSPAFGDPLSSAFSYTPGQLDSVRSAFAARPDIATLIQVATSRPECVFPSKQIYRGYGTIRECAREINTQTYLLAVDHHYSAAVDNEARVFQMVRHLRSDNTRLSYLESNAVDAIALAGMKDILALAGADATVDDRVGRAVADNELSMSVAPYLAGDIPEVVSYINLLKETSAVPSSGVASAAAPTAPTPGAGPRLPNALPTSPDPGQAAAPAAGTSPKAIVPPPGLSLSDQVTDLVDLYEAYYLGSMRQLIAAASNPAALLKAAAQFTVVDQTNPVQAITTPALPISSEEIKLPLSVRANEEVTRAAAYALGNMDREGSAPETLPASFVDPFNGMPLGYRAEGPNGFVVYSVGPTGNFDGTHAPDGYNPIFFRYPVRTVPVPKNTQ
ncbi:MAG: hypothetical protein ACLQVD_10025 [Capsulimonadaceae bacterium]